MSSALVVGVDGGGTKTTAVVLRVTRGVNDRLESSEVGRSTTGSSNRNAVGEAAASEALRSSVTGALEAGGCDLSHLGGACFGLSGVDTPEDEAALRGECAEWLPGVGHIAVHNDSAAALASGTGGRLEGCVLICGTGGRAFLTGTIVYGNNGDGLTARSSGWGPAFMDDGSGYDLGQRLLAAVARAEDGRGPATALTALALQHLQLKRPQDLLGWAYVQKGWAPVATLAPLVLTAATDGDEVAKGIVQGAVSGLVGSLQAVLRRAGLERVGDGGSGEPVPLVLAGGLLSEGSLLLPPLTAAIKEQVSYVDLCFPGVDAATGAALMAAHQVLC